MQDIVIYGIGGMAKETVGMIDSINQKEKKYNFVGFAVDDAYYNEGMHILGYEVHTKKWLLDHKSQLVCACCIGYPVDRRRVMIDLENEGVKFSTLISPSASIADENMIGSGCIIGPYCFVSPNVSIGKGVFFNGPMVVVGHDCNVEDYVTCFPKSQISGGCFIGEAALIGSMAYIHEKRKVGKEAVVAPGSIVMRNVKNGVHVIGNPAKVIEL